jgi:hypothetical protein
MLSKTVFAIDKIFSAIWASVYMAIDDFIADNDFFDSPVLNYKVSKFNEVSYKSVSQEDCVQWIWFLILGRVVAASSISGLNVCKGLSVDSPYLLLKFISSS